MFCNRLPLSTDKRHLVCGDIHAKYDTLLRLLESASYDPSKDILYSVGDIIDRGPKSFEVLSLFARENCHTVAGNTNIWQPIQNIKGLGRQMGAHGV